MEVVRQALVVMEHEFPISGRDSLGVSGVCCLRLRSNVC